MELANKAGEQQKATEPTKKPNKASKQGVILNAKEENPTAIRGQIKERGESTLDHEFGFKTAVKIEWKLPKACLQFNVQVAVINLLTKMIQVDPSLHTQSSVTTAKWKKPKDIPKDAEFTKELNVKQKSFKIGPVHVFIYPDRFLRNDVSSPGFLIELHTEQVRYDNLEEEVKQQLEKFPVPNTEVCKVWIWTHAPKHNANDATPVPDFSIKQAEIKWGRVKTTALKIHCVEKDGLYLKSMMSHTWEALETLRGTFVPAQAWLLTSPKTYHTLLHKQNKYINDTISITVEGLHPT
eukprot:14923524-Ditylum_brightwellii.AAC.1